MIRHGISQIHVDPQVSLRLWLDDGEWGTHSDFSPDPSQIYPDSLGK